MNLATRLLEETRKSHKRIVIVGDAMVDHWVHGRVEDCQDGCPKFVQESHSTTPGGAANAQRSLSFWGGKVDLLSFGDEDRPHKWRFIAPDGRIVYRWDDDRAENCSGYGWAHEHVLQLVGSADAVLLSDYDKGFLTPALIQQIAAACQATASRRGIPCVADCKREPEVYDGCVLKGNMDYFSRWTPNAPVMVCTRGELSPWCLERSQSKIPIIPDIPPVKCVNHVGAGDCFAAHLTLALACGFSLKEAAALSHSAGRVYVQYPHSRPPRPSEVEADLLGRGVGVGGSES